MQQTRKYENNTSRNLKYVDLSQITATSEKGNIETSLSHVDIRFQNSEAVKAMALSGLQSNHDVHIP